MQSKVKKNRSKNINNIADTSKSPQLQIKDAKFLRNENKAHSIFAKEKIIFLETIDDSKNLPWTILEHWKNMPFSDKIDFDIKTPTSNSSFSYCLYFKYPNQADEDLQACCHCNNLVPL